MKPNCLGQKTGFASQANDVLSRADIITRLFGFATRGYSRSALTLRLPALGWRL